MSLNCVFCIFLNNNLIIEHSLGYVKTVTLPLLQFNKQPGLMGWWGRVPQEIMDRDSVYLCACQYSLAAGGTGSCCLISLRLARRA